MVLLVGSSLAALAALLQFSSVDAVRRNRRRERMQQLYQKSYKCFADDPCSRYCKDVTSFEKFLSADNKKCKACAHYRLRDCAASIALLANTDEHKDSQATALDTDTPKKPETAKPVKPVKPGKPAPSSDGELPPHRESCMKSKCPNCPSGIPVTRLGRGSNRMCKRCAKRNKCHRLPSKTQVSGAKLAAKPATKPVPKPFTKPAAKPVAEPAAKPSPKEPTAPVKVAVTPMLVENPEVKAEKPSSETHGVATIEKGEAHSLFGFSRPSRLGRPSKSKKRQPGRAGVDYGATNKAKAAASKQPAGRPDRKLSLSQASAAADKSDDQKQDGMGGIRGPGRKDHNKFSYRSSFNPFASSDSTAHDAIFASNSDVTLNSLEPDSDADIYEFVESKTPTDDDQDFDGSIVFGPDDNSPAAAASEVNPSSGDKKSRRAQRKLMRASSKKKKFEECLGWISQDCPLCVVDDTVHSWKTLKIANKKSYDKKACNLCAYETKHKTCRNR